jgi:hypothetical protein
MSLHGDLSCVDDDRKSSGVDYPKSHVYETEEKPVTLRLVTTLFGLRL